MLTWGFITSFEQFFKPNKVDGAAPNVLGFDGFFKGAYSYHFHNFWCVYFIYLHFQILSNDSLPGMYT